ncbi:bifunctional riboflavin kinase/FAD synthetase [Bartonella sp. DGB1]|uniref:bifunctional riboflavin kinase/FAD synthetase n=1 Tax=Bartonella sp. DGB1 TaxID=3239807 RepID=UPI003523D3AB
MNEKINIFNNYENLSDDFKNSIVVIGNFDGIHIGHQKLLAKAKEISTLNNIPLLIFTFAPHPRKFFNAAENCNLILPVETKYKLLSYYGADAILAQNFNLEFANISAKKFIEEVLFKSLKAKYIIVGDNFYFGKKREGTPEFLKKYAESLGMNILLHQEIIHEDGCIVSSSNIRKNIASGNVKKAAEYLGYHYFVTSKIIHGDALGRKLGFPTANMDLGDNLKLPYGIYAIKCYLNDGRFYDGVASYGLRPTVVNNGRAILESHLFDFNEDIYSKIANIIFIDWIRKEEKFANLDQLVNQIKHDIDVAKKIIKTTTAKDEIDFLPKLHEYIIQIS